MKFETLLSQLTLGEESGRQFKADVKNAESRASEMAAFVYAGGGASHNTLLPKLISGELRIKDAEKFIERVESTEQQCNRGVP